MALKYELDVLEKLIIDSLHPKNFIHPEKFASKITEHRALLLTEKKRITQAFVESVYNSEERQREIYIQHHQKVLVGLADQVYNYLLPIDIKDIFREISDDPVVAIYQETFQCLAKLLGFIEHNFKNYFNQDEYVPEVYQLIKQEELKKKLKILEQKLTRQKVSTELARIILSPIKSYSQQNKVTYRQQIYFDEALTELSSVNNDQGVTETLVYLNFNSGEFVSYRLLGIVDNINKIAEQQRKIDKLSEHLKELNQLQAKQNVALRTGAQSAKEQISKWITEEIHYLEIKNRLLSVPPLIKDDRMLSDDEKLHFSVSVHVLGILARAAHDSRLLLNKKGTTVFKNVSKYCRTLQAKIPGAGSMDRKSHEAERSHKEKAITVLQEMIKKIYEY